MILAHVLFRRTVPTRRVKPEACFALTLRSGLPFCAIRWPSAGTVLSNA